MRSWNNVDDRRDATIAFAKFMEDPSNARIRQQCIDDPNEAKRQFAIIGDFDLESPNQPTDRRNLKPIPQSVEFKVYDATDPKRQDSVVLVLPSVTGKPSEEATDIWIAAWPVWTS